METAIIVAVVTVLIALVFDFLNGFHDSANVVATAVVSGAIGLESALILAAVSEFIGAYFLGTAVAETIGKGIVDPSLLEVGNYGAVVIASALVGAIFWNIITWYFGIPSSSSHALIGGLIGAFIWVWGIGVINWGKVIQIFLIMIISPIIGFVITYNFMRFSLFLAQWMTPDINKLLRKMQVVTLVTQAMAHGTNDGQKTMGVITFALIILGLYRIPAGESMKIPQWVIVTCSLAVAAGMGFGGRRIIRTLGRGFYKIRPIHGFASQTASTFIIYATSLLGFPISTTQVISSSILGAGAAFRPKMIRWGNVQNIVWAWFITIPASAFVSAFVMFLFDRISGMH